MKWLTRAPEDVAKGRNDRPVEDITIVDSGEVSAQSLRLRYRSYPLLSSLSTSIQKAKRYPSMLSSSQLLTCVKFIMRIKLSTPQDFDDESAHAVSLPDADSAGSAPSETGNPPVTSTGTILVEHSTHTWRYAVVGLVLFVIAAMIFMLMGGPRVLRRPIAMRYRRRYHKVDDEDPEK
jgi:hypothetical protein